MHVFNWGEYLWNFSHHLISSDPLCSGATQVSKLRKILYKLLGQDNIFDYIKLYDILIILRTFRTAVSVFNFPIIYFIECSENDNMMT